VRTRSGSLKGKCAYMPPEQLRSEPLDRRVDVFARGVVSFELVSGQRLFQRDNEYLTFKAVSEERIPQLAQLRPDAPPALVEAVARALERDRDRRFPTARALGEALLGAIAPLGGTLAPAAIAAEVERLVAPELAKRRAMIAHALLLTGDADLEARTDRVESATVVERFTFADRLLIKRRRSRLALLVVGVSAAGALTVLGAARQTPHPPAPAASLPVAAVGAAPVSLPPARQPSSTPTRERSRPRPSTAPLGSPGAATSPPSTSPHHTAASGARGFFSIDSKPYAAIYIDGKDLGTTPLFRVELPQGRHDVRAVSARGLTQTFNIRVQPGERALTRHLVW
jgi:eukaryotic-like serine/threonine-protein kinase